MLGIRMSQIIEIDKYPGARIINRLTSEPLQDKAEV